MARDVKGMWEKAVRGEIKNFTGYDAPFNRPKNPWLIAHTDEYFSTDILDGIIEKLEFNKLI